MFKKLSLFLLAGIVGCALSLLIGTISSQDSDLKVSTALAQSGGATPAGYKTVGERAGVWNNGQAAFWDLHAIDYFRFFGPATGRPLLGSWERMRGYKPEQPIKFSHALHVQQNKIECQFCHWTVAKSPYAAIPEVETCMGCHKFVKGSSEQGKADIAKLEEYYNKSEPIPWEKVHVMPDHVRFDHRRHIKAGAACHECHGQVPEMAVVERVSSMKMGWCVSCHRERGTSIDCWTCHK